MSAFLRASSCLLAFAIICLLNYHCSDARGRRGKTRRSRNHHKYPNKYPSNTHNRANQRKSQPKEDFENVLTNLRGQRTPKYHGVLLDNNLTDQLSAPRYMLNLYKNLTSTAVDDDSRGFNITNVTTAKNVQDADTIMGILNDVSDNQTDARSSFKMQFKFKFTAKMKTNESVTVAEFHVYKDSSQFDWMKNTSFVVELSVITVPGHPSLLHSRLASSLVHGSETGWLIFDITTTVDTWVVSPRNNYGLELAVRLVGGDSPSPISVVPAEFGFVGFNGPFEKRPFIVSFFRGDPTQRSVVLHASERKRRSTTFQVKTIQRKKKGTQQKCRLRHLYVDFHELKWQNWIIAPDGYESSYCDGECTYDMLSPKNVTNHAIVQTLVNLVNPFTVPSACCAPTKLNAISVLYYDNNQNVILKKFKDMVAKSCGCH